MSEKVNLLFWCGKQTRENWKLDMFKPHDLNFLSSPFEDAGNLNLMHRNEFTSQHHSDQFILSKIVLYGYQTDYDENIEWLKEQIREDLNGNKVYGIVVSIFPGVRDIKSWFERETYEDEVSLNDLLNLVEEIDNVLINTTFTLENTEWIVSTFKKALGFWIIEGDISASNSYPINSDLSADVEREVRLLRGTIISIDNEYT